MSKAERSPGGRPRPLPMLCLAVALMAGWMGYVASPAGAQSTAAPATMTKLHTSGSQILDAANKPFRIKAVSWFGMETSNCAPHGLWQISLDSGMAQIAGFGFNTIRLPFSNQCIEQTTPVTGIDAIKNPTLQNKTPLEIMDAVIASAKAHGLRVILDRHRPDSGSQSELWYTAEYPESVWIADWVKLAKRYAAEPAVVGADLHNEPHGSACWACSDPTRDWAAAATRAGNAVLGADPHLLIVVEGVEKPARGTSTWWGGGLDDVAAHPIALNVPHQLVYSPHDYPASIYPQTWFATPNYPSNLAAVWDAHFGYLQEQNIAPVLLGEFGTKLETASDQKWLAAMVNYLGLHQMSFAYWSFNPNSGDTGGLVQDDWVTPQSAKLAALQPLLGVPLTSASPAPSTSAPSTPAPSTPAPSTPAPSTPAPSTPSPTTGPAITGTATTGTGTATIPSPVSRAGPGHGVSASWSLESAWDTGYVANLVLTSGTPVSRWSLSWPDPGAGSVVNAWGMRCKVDGGRIQCTGLDWAAALPAGSSVRVGLQVAGDGSAPIDPQITVG